MSSEGRCGTCARFVRVMETISENGEVRRAGECLLNVWPSPLYETSTCGQYVQKGTFSAHKPKVSRAVHSRARSTLSSSSRGEAFIKAPKVPIEIPEELIDMQPDEFRNVLREVIREELGAFDVELGGRFEGGELVIKPGKEGTAEKRVPIESFFHKIVMIRDRLRVLEQRINGHPKLSAEDKVQMQQYITQSYGTLTTFNVLFANKDDHFVGQKGDKDEG